MVFPCSLLTFIQVYYALVKDGKSSENWKYEAFNQVYDGHLVELKKIQGDNPQCYHLILNRLFSNCMYVEFNFFYQYFRCSPAF